MTQQEKTELDQAYSALKTIVHSIKVHGQDQVYFSFFSHHKKVIERAENLQ